jgi:enolase
MKIKELKAREIKDTRGDKTIEIELITDLGRFIGSAPNGKSRGEYEAEPWKKSLKSDIANVNSCFIKDINIKRFDDLILIENTFKKIVGANTMIALEYTFLKALAKEEDKEIWQLINNRRGKFPMPIGNAIGGGKHSDKGPVFQEFHFIPEATFERAVIIGKRARENCSEILKNLDKSFKKQTSDENAWKTGLDNENVIAVIQDVKENMIDEFYTRVHCGIDCAASEFFSNEKYNYNKKKLSRKEQIEKIIELADKFFYIEDPLEQNDFDGFSEIMKKSKGLIVGDDLTATNYDRILMAIKKKSVNGVIIKPNQSGSLIEIKKIIELCKKNEIKTIFSHRSGETNENILADLAFGFQADYIKTGICGKGRDEKLNRMIEIERSLF